MRQSQDIYNDIGSGLLSIAPDTAVSLLMTMSINRVTSIGALKQQMPVQDF